MHIVILCIGKKTETGLAQLVDDYQKRLPREYQVEWKYLPSSRSQDESTCRIEESGTLLAQIKPSDQVILLDERGDLNDNIAFAHVFQGLGSKHGRLVFIIGGAYGVDDTVRKRASHIWSLSKLVFPHRLVRLIVMEQLYRTVMITKDHPYHHT